MSSCQNPLHLLLFSPKCLVTCISGTGLVTSLTGNQTLEPEPGTTVQDRFECILQVLDNAGPESFETNLSTKSHDTEPLGNRENSSTRLSAALFLVASRFYFKPSSKIQETHCAQAVGSAGQSQRVRQGQLPNFLPLQQWNAPGANFGLGIPGEGKRHARSGSRPLVDLLQAVVCELFCMSILGVRVPDVGCFPLCFLCPCLRPN